MNREGGVVGFNHSVRNLNIIEHWTFKTWTSSNKELKLFCVVSFRSDRFGCFDAVLAALRRKHRLPRCECQVWFLLFPIGKQLLWWPELFAVQQALQIVQRTLQNYLQFSERCKLFNRNWQTICSSANVANSSTRIEKLFTVQLALQINMESIGARCSVQRPIQSITKGQTTEQNQIAVQLVFSCQLEMVQNIKEDWKEIGDTFVLA